VICHTKNPRSYKFVSEVTKRINDFNEISLDVSNCFVDSIIQLSKRKDPDDGLQLSRNVE